MIQNRQIQDKQNQNQLNKKLPQERSNRFLRVFVICIVVLLAVCAVSVYILDPFFHFHGPVGNRKYSLGAEEVRYTNSGIAKNFNFDAMVTGSSMTWNMMPSQIDELWEVDAIKAPFPSGLMCEVDFNERLALDHAREEGTPLKIVIRSLDTARITYTKGDFLQEDGNPDFYPYYLQDQNPFNDVKYLFNIDVLDRCISEIGFILSKDTQTTSMDDYSTYSLGAPTGTDAVFYSLEDTGERVEEEKHLEKWEINNIRENLRAYYVDTALDYPETEFYIFVPPYSIAWWQNYVDNTGTFEAQMETLEIECEMLTDIPNLHFYIFWDDFELVTNLDNYYNYSHYDAETSRKLLQEMCTGSHLVTQDNYPELLETLRNFYGEYDYSGIYQ